MVINVSVQYSGPLFNRPSICRRPDSYKYFFLFVPFVSLEMSLFSSIFCTIAVFSLYGGYAVRSFLADVFFYLVTTNWIIDKLM